MKRISGLQNNPEFRKLIMMQAQELIEKYFEGTLSIENLFDWIDEAFSYYEKT